MWLQLALKHTTCFLPPAAALLILTGCASSQKTASRLPAETVMAQPAAAAIDAAPDLTRVLPQYRLGAGDLVEIKFFKNERFSTTQTIRPDGCVTLERIGDVSLNGLRPEEASRRIADRFRTFVLDPEVTLIVKEFGSRKVYVLGEVESPGLYQIEAGMTYLQAIAAAGGAKATGKLKSVIVMRKNGRNEAVAQRVNVLRFNQKPDELQKSLVQPKDVIYVPRTFIGNVAHFMSQLYASLLPPVDVYVRALLWKN